jgi:hypothetical protein
MFMPYIFNGINIYKLKDYAEHKLNGYAVDSLRHNRSTRMVMSLNVFGITIQLGRQLTV